MAISPSDFEFVRKLAREEAGLILEPGKEYLVESRMQPIVRHEGLDFAGRVVRQDSHARKARRCATR